MMLAADGLLTDGEVAAADWGDDPRHVDYGKIYESRFDRARTSATGARLGARRARP